MNKLTYKTIADAHARMAMPPIRTSFPLALMNKKDHKALYWASRYQSIHRLITHCSHKPKWFIFSGYKVVEI